MFLCLRQQKTYLIFSPLFHCRLFSVSPALFLVFDSSRLVLLTHPTPPLLP